jgi:hypothetical protein
LRTKFSWRRSRLAVWKINGLAIISNSGKEEKMRRIREANKKIIILAVLFFIILACTCNGATIAASSQNTEPSTTISAATETVTKQLVSTTILPTKKIIQPTATENLPFPLIGIWKADDMRAPDNSWNITYPIFMEFTNTKQIVYHGLDTFNRKIPTDQGELVYINISDSIFVKKIVSIPDNPSYLGKFQKWSWSITNGKALFTIYTALDSQEQAMKDNTVTALATGMREK